VEELPDMLPLHEAIPDAAQRFDARTFRRWKDGLILELARLTSWLHDGRYFHKDLYLCHFYIPRRLIAPAPHWQGQVHLIDLHRFGRHPIAWRRWQIKDLAQLLFSSDISGIDDRDRLCFWRAYRGPRTHGLRAKFLRGLVLLKYRRYRRHNAAKAA